MKISSHQLFDLIDEYAVEMLLEEAPINDSYEITIHEVKELISSSQVTVKKKFFKKHLFLLTAVLLLLFSGFSFALPDRGATLIDDSNRHLMDEKEMGTITTYDSNGKLPPRNMNKHIWNTSSIVKNVENGMITPKSITEIKATSISEKYITPEVMFENGDFIIFTKDNGDGWNLKKGDTLVFTINEYESLYDEGQSIVYYQIINGTFFKTPVYQSDTLEQHFELTAEKNGEYFICLACDSSNRISLKESSIQVKNANK